MEEGYSAVTDIVARKRRISSVGAGAVGSTSETTAHRKASDSPCLLALPSQNSDSSAMEAASAIKAQRRTSRLVGTDYCLCWIIQIELTISSSTKSSWLTIELPGQWCPAFFTGYALC